MWTNDYKSLNFNSLRSEYLSIHLKQGAPAFSPNNFKIGLPDKQPWVSFFTVVLLEEEYTVNYHLHILDSSLTKIVTKSLYESKHLG